VRLKCSSLKIKWLPKIIDNRPGRAFSIGKYYLENFDKSFKGLNVLTSNLRNIGNDDIPLLSFYQDMVKAWQDLKHCRLIQGRLELLKQEFLFLNPLFFSIMAVLCTTQIGYRKASFSLSIYGIYKQTGS